ncbi:MAG: SpoIIE family protein phosphatase [Holophagales bacterium]|jgi:serine phosphatase RsbU (regulator of sigma subunit)|nr:SpoIIE family protein phosphatase [Holophagales bacterium]
MSSLHSSILNIRWRLFWTSLIALVLAVGSFSLAQWIYTHSDDQCLWSVENIPSNNPLENNRPKVIIRSVIPKGPTDAAALFDGDELIAIHDLKVPEYSDKLTPEENRKQIIRLLQKMMAFINSTPDGTTVQYTVIRDGQKVNRPVELKKVFDSTNALLLLTGLVSWSIGLLVVLSSPQRKVARHFYYLGALTLILVAGASTRGPYTVPIGIDLITRCCLLLFNGLFPPMWFHFFLRFPYGFEIRKRHVLLIGIYAINILALLPEGMVVLIGLFGLSSSDWLMRLLLYSLPININALETAGRYFQVILLGLGVLLFWKGSLTISDRRRRALMAPLLLTTAVFLDLLAYIWLAKTYSGTLDRGFFMRYSHYLFLPLPFLPLTFAYSILRHGFFDVRRVIVRWLSYFIALGVLSVTYLCILAWVFVFFIPTKISMAKLGVIVGLLTLPLGWILRWILVALRRKFKRDVSSARELILGNLQETKKRFSDDALLECLVVSIQEAFRPQVLLVLPISQGKVVLPSINKHKPVQTIQFEYESSQELKLPSSMFRYAKENRELVFGLGNDESDWIMTQSKALRNHMEALGAQIMILFMAGELPHSVLLLGGKYAELNYSREDRELLREVAIAVGALFETASMHNSLIDKTRQDQELQAARNIQESLTTSNPPDIPGFQIASRLVPASETGGDLLWVKQRAPGHWIAIVGDISGKGLPAAIYMSQSMALLEFATRDTETPLEKILAGMDITLRNLMGPKDFLTLCIIEWYEDGRFKVVRAGHPPPIHLSKALQNTHTYLMPPGLALGMLPACSSSWHVYEGTLQHGDWIAMYSDGITEAMNHNGNLYGVDRLTEQLKRFWGTGSPRAACEAVFQQVSLFEVQNKDDRTLFLLARGK